MAQRQEKEMDYLEPLLEQLKVDIKNPKLTRQQAVKLRDDCLTDFKQRLVDKANLIQASFEKVRLSRRLVSYIVERRTVSVSNRSTSC